MFLLKQNTDTDFANEDSDINRGSDIKKTSTYSLALSQSELYLVHSMIDKRRPVRKSAKIIWGLMKNKC
jgi:hypothetical protein